MRNDIANEAVKTCDLLTALNECNEEKRGLEEEVERLMEIIGKKYTTGLMVERSKWGRYVGRGLRSRFETSI